MKLTYTAILGSSIADALGVPVEFKNREYLLYHNPVRSYIEYGTHFQPSGTWSDDTSMTLCLMDSMINCKGIDYYDIMNKFVLWKDFGEYTPFNYTFDIGNATYKAINKYKSGIKPLECGSTDLYSNGNGSLMRIMPMVLYSYCMRNVVEDDKIAEFIINCSQLTHAHPISLAACLLYYGIVEQIIDFRTKDIFDIIQNGIRRGSNLYEKYMGEEFPCEYKRLMNIDAFGNLYMDSIRSSGYVVDTLEAAIWCCLKYTNYKECVLAAVNLGGDTDTVGAVTGALVALYYGEESIPMEWIYGLQRREYIEELCNRFDEMLGCICA